MVKKILIALLVVFIVIQFFRPERNISTAASDNDISNHYEVPADVVSVLKKACYDCHSNNTTYPWYANIQPVAWWLNDHITEGKSELNFSEFGTYKPKKQAHKMEEVAELVEEGEMPLSSYTIIHKNAVLDKAEKTTLVNWAKQLETQIKTANNL